MDIGYVKSIGRATFIYKDYNVFITFRVYPLCTIVIGIYSIANSYFKGLIVLFIA